MREVERENLGIKWALHYSNNIRGYVKQILSEAHNITKLQRVVKHVLSILHRPGWSVVSRSRSGF